ncbi:DNA-3-methyladenine glycosylase I [Saccharicrinis fermentans]|uniref:DNA-3-methyladenine glycosylase 1 n=1 Tax=Saccharicrinis fermentans DSM 9555 = JCM 21142 TaxID=869213 RepID=W7YPR1_9BACT|nr:DNA-3-methyladenine glycosylase I [Saccharicrinis fermentans]GAF04414.1 DNA-3-methyladenine glycosylase 1 [Saccharicrinis fermentans DSM 9555 = JCM 21142]
MKKRCSWCEGSDLYRSYHDKEWGMPLHDDDKLFEFLVLESFQAGLSWSTILNKREAFRLAFDDFDAAKIVNYNEEKIFELLNNAHIIRNRLKINATVHNAETYLHIKKKYGSFDKYIWQFTDFKVIKNAWSTEDDIPPTSPVSDKMSKQLKKDGFKFVGTTICYAYLQAIGAVNDHITSCFRYHEVGV